MENLNSWFFIFYWCYATTQLVLQLRQELLQLVCSNKEAQKQRRLPEALPQWTMDLMSNAYTCTQIEEWRTTRLWTTFALTVWGFEIWTVEVDFSNSMESYTTAQLFTLTSACEHPPSSPYALTCAQAPATTSVFLFAKTRNLHWSCANLHVFMQERSAYCMEAAYMQWKHAFTHVPACVQPK